MGGGGSFYSKGISQKCLHVVTQIFFQPVLLGCFANYIMDYDLQYFLSPTVKKAIELKSRGVKLLPSKDTNHKNAVCKYFLIS